MKSQANVVTSQVKAMMVQMNREVESRVPQHANNMTSHLRDFTTINPPMFIWSRYDEGPKYFLMRSITFAILWV